MDVKGKEEAFKSIEAKLSNYKEQSTQRCICKVHDHYLPHGREKANLNEPLLVAIGPYHRGKQGLERMEEHKIWYLKTLLRRKKESVDIYISAVAEIEKEARSYYAEDVTLMSAAEFIEMLVLDGCFLIELVQKFKSRDSSRDSGDVIFQMDWVMQCLQSDLFLFENQIPFFVVCKLFDLIRPKPNPQHNKLVKLFCLLYGMQDVNAPYGVNPKEVKHLLHLVHAISRSLSIAFITPNACPLQTKYRVIPFATELRDSNVTFRKSKRLNIGGEVDFTNGVLTMSSITIHHYTEKIIRNFIVYEQYFPNNQPTYVTDYMVVLNCLINTPQDVEILSRCGIIDNMVGDNQVVAAIINRLTHSVTQSGTYFIHGDTFNRINTHYKKRWNRTIASLNRDYFNSPWAYISFVAALLLLLLTITQTVLSGFQL